MIADVCLSLAVLIGLAVGTVVTGRAVVVVCGMRVLRRWTPENVLTSAFVGTAVWILTFGYGSYLGLAAPRAALVVLGLSAVLAAVRTAARPGMTLPPRRRWAALAVVLVPILIATAAVLLPVIFGDGFVFYTDSILYDNVGEWLQLHAFREAAAYDPRRPMWGAVALLQELHHRMGPMFLLALLRSLCPGCLCAQLYPAVTAWGVALNVAAVYLLCRWSFRCGAACALFAALLTAGVNPLSYSANYGFLCQVYGTAVLPFCLAVLARLTTRTHWRFGEAALFALGASLQLSVYSELAPVLAAASLLYLAPTAVRAWRTARFRRFLAFTGAAVLLFGLFANIEIWRAASAVAVMARVNGVGWHIDWTPLEYWAFAMGARPYPTPLGSWPLVALLPGIAMGTALFLAGIGIAVRRRRAWPVIGALLVLGGLTAYFHWLGRDPWTGAVGHTWDQFKLCKWSFSLVAAVQGAGLHFLLGRLPRLRVRFAAACLPVIVGILVLHGFEARAFSHESHMFMGSKTPLASLRELRRQVRDLNPSSLYFISNPVSDPHYTALVLSVLYSHPFLNGWSNKRDPFYHSAYVADRNPWPPPDDMLGVMEGEPPFDAPLRRLPCGLSAVDLRKPFVVRIDNPGGAAAVLVWSPRSGTGTLSLAATGDVASVPLTLRPGLNYVNLRRPDAPSPTLCLERMEIHLDGEQASGPRP